MGTLNIKQQQICDDSHIDAGGGGDDDDDNDSDTDDDNDGDNF